MRGKNKKGFVDPEIADRVCVLAKRGRSLREISKIIGVKMETLRFWLLTDYDFRCSFTESEMIATEFVRQSLFSRAVGYYYDTEKIFYSSKKHAIKKVNTRQHVIPDVNAQMFWLKSKEPGKWRGEEPRGNAVLNEETPVSFSEFCSRAGYPAPYLKQVEMQEFVVADDDPRLLLGSRGYGKTDYCVILGVGYQIYVDQFKKFPEWTCLLITKSDQRNAAILTEVVKACEANGVAFDKVSASGVRVKGLLGKDHSLSAVTIGTSSLRGRHPKQAIMEDVVTEEDVSVATRKKVQRVYNEVNKLTSNVCVIGQPVHKFDLYETLRPRVKRMEVPYGSIPELDVDLEAQRIAGVSEESIQASYYLKVLSENATPLENVKYIEAYPKGDSVAFIDPSFEGGDYTALTILRSYFDGIAVQGHVYKRAWNHCLDLMVARMIDCGVKRLCFETNSLGDQPVIMLRDAMSGIGVVGKKSTGHKHSRISAAGAYSHLIHLAKSSDQAYIDQVVKYEYGAEHDDAPDSLASAMEWVGLIRGKK